MRQQPAARLTTLARESKKSQTVQMSRKLHQKAHAGHGQATKSEDLRLHAERDVAFAGVLREVAAVAVHVPAIQQIREAPASDRQTYRFEAIDARQQCLGDVAVRDRILDVATGAAGLQ